MASQITVSGLIQHRQMPRNEVVKRIREYFPNLQVGPPDFVIPLSDAYAEFYCDSAINLQFRIVPGNAGSKSALRAVPAAEVLVRSTETLWKGLEMALCHGSL